VLDGIIDLGDHTVADVMNDNGVQRCFTLLQEHVTLNSAIEELKKPSIRMLVGVDRDGKPRGAIMRAHHRHRAGAGKRRMAIVPGLNCFCTRVTAGLRGF
jgi:hypothetical protein